ncbi:Ubiquitin domain-containing protein ubfd1 [Rhizophlyctis rosea]|nr:Ubiquitin domain-containing protein ubfd1 [Rhizophlyctis rosea]
MTDSLPVTNNDASTPPKDTPDSSDPGPQVTFKVQYKKDSHDVTMGESDTVLELKKRLEELTGVHVNMQKLLWKGMPKDTQTLSEAKIKDGVKVMLMGSNVEDVLKIASGPSAAVKDEPEAAAVEKPSWSDLTEHKKIIQKGKPDDAEPGIRSTRSPLPARGVVGLLNSRGMKTRLTFKNDTEELQIGTNERTQKVRYNSIQTVTSQPIKGMDEYHIMALQLGPTEK